ncbi:MAG TPA: hypothetical protein VHO90_02405 [Bacteroidales bacterium]|nr:hypothetical protein [Bacteroidales bacterium]
MKRTLLLFVAVMFTATMLTKAQPSGRASAEDRAKRQTEAMTTQLSLTDDQQTKVNAINLKYAKQMDEVFAQRGTPGGDRDEMHKKMTAIETSKREELSSVLNADQLKKYDEMVAERQKNRPGPRPQQQ